MSSYKESSPQRHVMKRSNSQSTFGLFTSTTALATTSVDTSTPEDRRQNVLDVMGITVDNNVVELEKLKGIIKIAKEKSNDFGQSKKARSLNKVGMWEELEQLYKDLETREKDYQVAMAIGKMLLEKNKELIEQRDHLQQQFEQSLQQRDSQITELLEMVEKYTDKKQELQSELKGLRIQVSSLQNGSAETETKALLMYEEYNKLEEKSSKYKQQLRQAKLKNKELDDEIEKYKTDMEQMKQTEKTLRRQLKDQRDNINQPAPMMNNDLKVTGDRDTVYKLEEDLRIISAKYQTLQSLMDEISGENLKLREGLEARDSDKEQLNNVIQTLKKAMENLQDQREEDKKLLEQKSVEVEELRSEVEQFQMANSLTSPSNNNSLQNELIDFAMNNRLRRSSLTPSVSRGNLLESASSSYTSLDPKRSSSSDQLPTQSQERASRSGSDANIETIPSEFRQKSEDHALLSTIYELRDRLIDSDIKNISRAMPNVYYFEDIIQISNSIIDSVTKDTKRKILDKQSISDLVRCMADLIIEICKLRKRANDYAEAINHGTVEKLEKYRQYLVGELELDPSSGPRKQTKKWGLQPIFDFFTGWQPSS